MKIGMVLEGGGMRGMYTAGILDVMMENEINLRYSKLTDVELKNKTNIVKKQL